MLKKLMITTAAAALIAGSAYAQSAQQPAPLSNPGSASAGQFVASQSSDQWLASNFYGTDVIGNNDEKIGDVNDVLFDKEGKVIAYVVGIGGFLGIGEKNVALAPTSFQAIAGTDASALKLRLSMTKEQLTQAQAFETTRDKELAARRAPTGTSNPMSPRPGSSNTPPTTNR